MYRNYSKFALVCILLSWAHIGLADPEMDKQEFRTYFLKTYPDVHFDDYADGVVSMPDMEAERKTWQKELRAAPYRTELELGKAIWETPFSNGENLSRCFVNGGIGIAQNYPYWDDQTKTVRTLELDINACRERNDERPYDDLLKGELAAVTAYMKSLAQNKRVRIKLDASKRDAIAAYNRGRHFFWAKRGRQNLSCADCHVERTDRSPALGQGVNYPVYRPEWDGLGTLHRRYIACMQGAQQAKPFAAQSQQFRELELYQAYMNSDLPLNAPGYRSP